MQLANERNANDRFANDFRKLAKENESGRFGIVFVSLRMVNEAIALSQVKIEVALP
jgi:hypothetical protein